MIVVKTGKPYSWLQWPVALKNFSVGDPHVTAKFFGEISVDEKEIARLLTTVPDVRQHEPDIIAKRIKWKPVRFADLFVLEFTVFPRGFQLTHDLFKSVKDQHTIYRPHITVNEAYWERILVTASSPHDELLTFGEIQLHVGAT